MRANKKKHGSILFENASYIIIRVGDDFIPMYKAASLRKCRYVFRIDCGETPIFAANRFGILHGKERLPVN